MSPKSVEILRGKIWAKHVEKSQPTIEDWEELADALDDLITLLVETMTKQTKR